MTRMLQLLHLFSLILLALHLTYGYSNCSKGQYLNRSNKTCVPCSACKSQNYVVKPCSAYADVTCIHTADFYWSQLPRQRGWNVTAASAGIEQSQEEAAYWQRLAYMSVAVMLSIMIVVTMVLALIWYKWRGHRRLKMPLQHIKQQNEVIGARLQSFRWAVNEYASVDDDDDCDNYSNNYSDIYSSHSLMRQRQRLFHNYRPQRRIVDTLEDDVFESVSDTTTGYENNRVSADLSIPNSVDDISRPLSKVFTEILHISEGNSRPNSQLLQQLPMRLGAIAFSGHEADRRFGSARDPPICGSDDCDIGVKSSGIDRDSKSPTRDKEQPVPSVNQIKNESESVDEDENSESALLGSLSLNVYTPSDHCNSGSNHSHGSLSSRPKVVMPKNSAMCSHDSRTILSPCGGNALGTGHDTRSLNDADCRAGSSLNEGNTTDQRVGRCVTSDHKMPGDIVRPLNDVNSPPSPSNGQLSTQHHISFYNIQP